MASALDPYNLDVPAQQPKPAGGIPAIPGLESPLSTNPALAQHQMETRSYATQGIEAQQRAIQAQAEQASRSAATEMAQAALNPDIRGKAFHELTPEMQKHYVDAYPSIAPQIPGMFNDAQRHMTGNPDIGVPAPMQGIPVSRTVDEKGNIRSSYQTIPKVSEGDQGDSVANLPEQERGLAKQIANYQLPYNSLARMSAVQRMRIMNAVPAINPDFDENQYQTRQSVMKSFASGADAANRASANTLIGHFNELYQAGKALKNWQSPAANAVGNFIERNAFGSPTQTRFQSAMTAVADEMAKLFKGTGAASDSAIRDWKATISPNMSPDQLKAAIGEGVNLMQSRLDALKSKYEEGMRKPMDFEMLNPNSKAVLRNLEREGVYTGQSTEPAPQQQQQEIPTVNSRKEYDALPSGSRYVDSNGRQAVKK